LHEFELAIGTEVLVAEAPGDLVIPIDPTNHAQLLEQLGALRKRVERAGRQSTRHDKIPSTFWRRCNEHWGFDLDETLIVHRPTKRTVDFGANSQIALHALGTKVNVTMSETHHFVDLNTIVQLERRWFRDVENLDVTIADLDFTSRHVVVGCAIRTLTNCAGDSDHIFRTEIGSTIDDALDETSVIPKIDECEMLAVLSASGDPAANGNFPTDIGGSQGSAVVGAHGDRVSHG